ncbi:hypothetical protein [Pseudomonas sp. DC3000-4b1]|uniref:hypothetical protein n=1 Tax=unclassified Pseudomonas TaxID=196821 RepID=UPI003CEB540F
MAVLSVEQLNSLDQYMNDPTIQYPQRIRYFFYTCKEQVSGQYRVGVVKRLDQVLAAALLVKQEWHDSLKLVLSQAVELNALHSSDCETFLSHLVRCTPTKHDRPPARQYRRVGQPRAY